jgi:hypothetical protein
MRKFVSAATIVAGLAITPMPIAVAHEGHAHNLPVVAGTVTKVDEAAGKSTMRTTRFPICRWTP